ncbi:phosphorothioated DNA-binding restriction endonuclease [Kitasatospora sp. NPDC048540]|uniref:phosphorothioated DNA-binding restriction endonuclease n=1 Tax=Kitasatospora sp. NPDC048540 TaxID=3155634 RepID=UPI0033F70739
MRRSDLLAALAGIRQATIGGRRAPHKPLLLLWLLGRYARTGSSEAAYVEAEAPVSRLINDFGPAIKNPHAASRRAAMPFVHLERSLWVLRNARGEPLESGIRDDSATLRRVGAIGRLHPQVESLLGEDPTALPAAVRLLLEHHFTASLEPAICDQAGLGLPNPLPTGDSGAVADPVYRLVKRKVRDSAFAEAVLRSYNYACAMCGYDGTLGGRPVGLEAAHIRWHSQGGPDLVDNGLALCSLHHALFDFRALGVTAKRTVRVSPVYAAETRSGRAVEQLHGAPVALPRQPLTSVAYDFLHWHDLQVFKHAPASAR